MTRIIFSPIKLVSAGMAFWGAWTLGSYLGDVALGRKDPPWKRIADILEEYERQEPLWKRRFTPISGTR